MKKIITLNLEEGIHAKLKRDAERAGVSGSEYVEALIYEHGIMKQEEIQRILTNWRMNKANLKRK